MPHSIIFDTPELLDGHPCAPPSVTWCAASSRTIASWFSLLLPAQMSSWWVPSFLLPPALPRRHDWHIDGGDVQDAHEVTHGPPSWLFEWSRESTDDRICLHHLSWRCNGAQPWPSSISHGGRAVASRENDHKLGIPFWHQQSQHRTCPGGGSWPSLLAVAPLVPSLLLGDEMV